jgi:hypothetical protein
MALWTVIADYRGGTYISQVRGANVSHALMKWAKSFPRISGSFVGAKTKESFVSAASDKQEKPTLIQGTRNVWYWNPLRLRPRIVVHLVKTNQN